MTRFDPATEDFVWLLRHVVSTQDILTSDVDLDTLEQVIDTAANFIGDRIAPINVASEEVGVSMVDGRVVTPPGWRGAWREWGEGGWAGLAMSADHGGQAMPFLAQAVVATMLGAADVAFAMVSASARGAASVLAAHGSDAQKGTCLPRLASGEWTATIVITEPQAGSDVGLIRTKAVPQADGSHALSGTKIFISGGDHDLSEQILHIVLARVEGAAPGVKGLTLFLVPSRHFDADGTLGDHNGVRASRIEEKMGLHGSATCVLDLEAAQGFQIGAEGQGLGALFVMMNELRLEVALSAVGLCAGATRHAEAYAQERLQGRDLSGKGPAAISGHPDVRRMLDIMAALTEGGRALILEAARLVDLDQHGETPDVRRDAADRLAWLLPICKAALSDNALDVTNHGIQIRGGHGYVRESGAEQFYRDARVLPIYEGANGIHAGALATRGLQKDGGASARAFIDLMQADVDATAGEAAVQAIRACVEDGMAGFRATTEMLLTRAEQAEAVLLVSYDYITLAGRLALAWMWLRMAAADVPADDVLIGHKRRIADFYALHYGPEMAMLVARIAAKMNDMNAGRAATATQPALV
jgi:alkylation response protein AidB-like acyl-CoA dehydrogenase